VADDGALGLAQWRVAADFARQLEHLAAAGFSSIGLEDWLATRRREPASLARRIVLNHSLIGGSGIDTADYAVSAGAVVVNLFTGTGLGGDAEGDALTAIATIRQSRCWSP